MTNDLLKLLSILGYPIYLQGSMSDTDEYPSSFLTYWNEDVKEGMFYNNKSNNTTYVYRIFFYTDDIENIDKNLKQIEKLLVTNNGIITQKGIDVASDEPTHIGKMLTVLFIRESEENK